MSVQTGVAEREAAHQRDPFIDLCRAFSLLVVVLWHWVFTILVWRPDGPRASNPIGFTSQLWPLTWLLQVLPLFFFVGGYAHSQLWVRTRGTGGGYRAFVVGRLLRLAIPSVAVLLTWATLGALTVAAGGNDRWVGRGVKLVVSPLWFVGVYLLLVMLAPLALRAHERPATPPGPRPRPGSSHRSPGRPD